mgnify:CR=1 FL=1
MIYSQVIFWPLKYCCQGEYQFSMVQFMIPILLHLIYKRHTLRCIKSFIYLAWNLVVHEPTKYMRCIRINFNMLILNREGIYLHQTLLSQVEWNLHCVNLTIHFHVTIWILKHNYCKSECFFPVV